MIILLALAACINTTQQESATDPVIESVTLNYSQANKSLFISAEVIDPQGRDNIASVAFRLYHKDLLNVAEESLFPDTVLSNSGPPLDIIQEDNFFSYLLDSTTFVGNEDSFWVRVTVQAFDKDGNSSEIEEREDEFKPNSRPELFLFDSPSNYEKGDTVIFKVRATDPQGVSDISSVYFSVLQPNGNYKGDWELVDNGLPFNANLWIEQYFGDEIAHDGIYTNTIIINKDNELQGKYTFYFMARDIHGSQSDTTEKIITVPGVHLLSPNWADTLRPYQTYTITWESAYVNKVTIQYTTNANSSPPNYQTITTEFAVTGSYDWEIPYENSANCKIQIFDADSTFRYDTSDNSFTIKP